MQVIEIDDILAARANVIARTENRSLSEFVSVSLLETLERKAHDLSDEDKIKRFAASYQKFPERVEDYEIWESEQVWEEE